MTNYFYHHDNKVYSWCNNRLCKPVDQSCIFLLYGKNYQFIEGCGTDLLTIDPGELLFCKETCRGNFDSGKVNAIKVNNYDKKESNKNSEGNSVEKMPKKKVRKFVPIEKEDKELQLALENETFDRGKNDVKKMHLERILSKEQVD